MATVSTQVLALGYFSTELDNNESLTGAEKASSLVNKSFGTQQNPLWSQRTSMTMVDGNNDGTVSFANKVLANNAKDYISFNTPTGVVKRTIDAGVMYRAEITYADGTKATANIRVIQDGQGNLFLLPPPRSAPQAEISAVTSKPIASIKFLSVQTNNYSGLDTSRFGLPGDPTFACFDAETLIRTAFGERRAGDLAIGELIVTLDGSLSRICWIGMRHLDAHLLKLLPNLRPIRIRAGALGVNTPASDLLVSPQHRVLIRSKVAQNMFGTDEVLVAAKHLCALDWVEIAEDVSEVSYVHFLLEKHEVIFANGAEIESMFTGAQALEMVGPEARDEIVALFPELASPSYLAVPARPLIAGKDSKKLALRIKQKAALLEA